MFQLTKNICEHFKIVSSRLRLGKQLHNYNAPRETWWPFVRVEAFRPEGRGFEYRYNPPCRDLGQVLNSLRREIPAQYPSCVGGVYEK